MSQFDAPEIAPASDAALKRLVEIMARLRDPVTGCPWDIEQTFESIAPHTIEEAYEVADAITRNAMSDLKEELGDLLLQIVFHSQMAAEQKLFDLTDVIESLSEKLIYRHPHVFGDAKAETADDVALIWDAKKDAAKAAGNAAPSAIDGVTLGLPALLRAQKLQKKAQKTGFVWPDTDAAWAKVEEELAELRSASGKDAEAEEMGDLLFCLVNYARMKGHDCEEILATANRKFERRFKAMENMIGTDSLSKTDLQTMLDAWADVKSRERA